jgi:uncharacterized iron-regulated membrane protein
MRPGAGHAGPPPRHRVLARMVTAVALNLIIILIYIKLRSFPAPPLLNRFMRKFAVFLHRYLGLALAVLLLVSSLTGTAVVFSKPIDAWLNPQLLGVAPGAEPVPVDAMLARLRQALPARNVSMVFVPHAADRAWEFWFHEDKQLRAYVDPYTGDVLGQRRATESLMGFLVDLHIHLLAGETGEQVMGWAGLGAVLLCALGLYLWWPRRGRWKNALSIKWQAAPVRLWLDVHKVVGAVSAVLIMLTALTGSLIALHEIVAEPLLTVLTGEGTRQAVPQSRAAHGGDAPLAPMLAKAQATFPGARLSRISLPAHAQGAVTVRMRLEGDVHQFGRSFLWFDRYDGRLLKASNILKANLASRIQNWFYPLHTGFYGGTATRWLQLLVGLAMSLITLSGAWLWWKGWRARRIAALQAAAAA